MTTTDTNVELVSQLNDLLQLDHDAVAAYDLAIASLESVRHQQALQRFKADHERHITELSQLVTARGGTPMEASHVTSGPFKLAMQAAGKLGGDRGVLLAFKANERQVRDKYRRMAEAVTDPEVADVLNRGADDEAKHYGWAVTALEDLGVPSDSPLGRFEQVMEVANARLADAAERVERGAQGLANNLRTVTKRPDAGMMAAVAAVGLGLLAAGVMRKRR